MSAISPKSLEKQVFSRVIRRYYFEPSNPQATRDLGIPLGTLRRYLYQADPLPQRALNDLTALLPRLLQKRQDLIQKKIAKLENYLKVVEEEYKSDLNQLEALQKQKRKGKKIAPELEEFDLIFKTNPKNQL